MISLRYGPLREILETVILALLVFILAREAVQNFQVDGTSMAPTLADSDFVLVNKITYARLDLGPFDFLVPGKSNGDYLFGGPHRGDVVVFRSPTNPARDFVKRVIAVPGDVIEVRDRRVFVNGVPLAEEGYTLEAPRYQFGPEVVPTDHFFVLGDNRNRSQDSHEFGPIHSRLIVGQVWCRWFPLDDLGCNSAVEIPIPEAAVP